MPITSPRVTPLVQPVGATQKPIQIDTPESVEWKGSREQSEDLQRGTSVWVHILKGRPDQAAQDQATGGLRLGFPHPFEPHTYLVHAKFEHYIHGADPQTSDNTPTSDRDNVPYTRMTLTYRQMPCPGKWEEEDSIALVSRLEWYDRLDPPHTLQGTRQSVPILIPVPVHKRHFPKVFLSPAQKTKIEETIGLRNGEGWRGRPPGFWLLEGWRTRLLYGDPTVGTAAWEVTLIWRGDPERHHGWWWPILDDSYRPLTPNVGPPPETREAFFQRAMKKRTLYGVYEGSFDELVPLRGTPCDPSDSN
jgi:hypothetical protein